MTDAAKRQKILPKINVTDYLRSNSGSITNEEDLRNKLILKIFNGRNNNNTKVDGSRQRVQHRERYPC